MKSTEFDANITAQLDRSEKTLLSKGEEYATGTDRLHNFRVAAQLQDTTMRKALAGMMAKHTTSVYDMCNSDETFSREKWNEKITDHINYLLILQAVLYDERSVLADANELTNNWPNDPTND